MAVAAVIAGPAVISASAVAPGEYDNTVNTLVNNQTTGVYRDVIWWGESDKLTKPYDYINAGMNLITNGHSAVVGGDDFAINFTGQRCPNGGQSWITVFDETPQDGTATMNTFDFTQPGGVDLTADVLFANDVAHSQAGGILAMYDETSMDGLALVAQQSGGNNHDFNKLKLIYQVAGTGIDLVSQDLGSGAPYRGDTNAAVATGPNSGDHWYRVTMNIQVSGDVVTVHGEFWNHTDPTDPNSALGTQVGLDVDWVGSLAHRRSRQ